MSPQAPGKRLWYWIIVVMGLLGMHSGWSPAADAILDAKRKAAAQLFRDGKFTEAVSLTREVLSADDSACSDHLLLARAHEKLGQSAEAIRQYKRVLDLVPASASRPDDKTARAEADKKLKLLDPLGTRVEALTDDVLRKLDGLEKEAVSLKSMSGLERIFRLRGHIWAAEHRDDRTYYEVLAKGEWQDSGLVAKAGQSYHVRAAGAWQVKGSYTCSAHGTTEMPLPPNYGRVGQLLGIVGGKVYVLDEDALFTCEATGPVFLLCNDDIGQAGRVKNTGSLHVLIERR